MSASFLYTLCIKGIPCIFLLFLLLRARTSLSTRTIEPSIGTKIITRGGLLGTICSLRQETVILQVYDGTRVEILRTAIESVLNDT